MKIIPVAGMLAFFAILPVAVQAREFTDSNGNIIDAELVSHKGGKVKILRKDGKEFEVDPAVFSPDDMKFIIGWMQKTPELISYNLGITADKKKTERSFTNRGYKRIKNDSWVYEISITNNSQDVAKDLKVEYRIFHTNSADGEFSSTSSGPRSRVTEGSAKLEENLEFNRTSVITTEAVQIDVVNYDYGPRYKDEVQGLLLRILGPDDKQITEWVSPGLTMKGKTWENTKP